jgi:threonine synthase
MAGLSFRCAACGREYPLEAASWNCACGGPFELAGGPAFSRAGLEPGEWSLWRYRAFLPVEERVSLGEGLTPLVALELFGLEAHFKLEFLMPTGSFKDRGTAVLVSFLKERGIREVVEDSSGNAAASLAAYCARAGIRARIFVPSYASPAKLRQIEAYGAELVPVPGSRADAARAAEAAARAGSYYASHYWSPFVLEGLKTFAYELAEQLGWRAPDNLIFPSGHGTFLLGAYFGFRELAQAGAISRLPRLFAAQAEACAPLAEGFRLGLAGPAEITPGETIAEGIRIARPVRGPQVLKAIRESAGGVVTVSDAEAEAAQRELARHGLYVEPTSAVAVAGLQRLVERGSIRPGELTVVPLTGSGLKGGSG